MTIKEKLTTLGLSPSQTMEITLLLTEAYTAGAYDIANMTSLEPHPAIVADMAMKVLNVDHVPNPGVTDITKFSAVFGYDFSNDLP